MSCREPYWWLSVSFIFFVYSKYFYICLCLISNNLIIHINISKNDLGILKNNKTIWNLRKTEISRPFYFGVSHVLKKASSLWRAQPQNERRDKITKAASGIEPTFSNFLVCVRKYNEGKIEFFWDGGRPGLNFCLILT